MAKEEKTPEEKQPIVINIGALVSKIEFKGEFTDKQTEEIKAKVAKALYEILRDLR